MINRATRKLKLIASRLTVPEPQRYGVVQKIVGMTIEATGLNAPLGSICLIENSDGHRSQAQIVGFSEDAILMMSFSGPIGIEPEAKVYVRNSSDVAMVGNSALGRVLDAAGLPIDGGNHIFGLEEVPLESEALNPMRRKPIEKKFDVF